MSKLLLAALLCLMVIVPSSLAQEGDISVDALLTYNKWRYNHKRVYFHDEEQIYRQQVFFDNLKVINAHSKDSDATYEVGLNQFSDMTKEEFVQRILNKKLAQKKINSRLLASDSAVSHKVFPAPPKQVDWRTKGVVNAIKDQGECGSCWTFASAGVMESFNAIVNKKLERFSEQQLVDCVHRAGYESDGCDGGFQEDGVRYAMKYGIAKSSSYPYVGFVGRCKVTSPLSSSSNYYPKKFQPIPATSQDLKAALAFAPVSVSVDASNWENYSRGVFNRCGPTTANDLNHAVIAVGYDERGNWIIRNSWNTSWGENGYMRLAAGNTCGVLLDNLVVTE